MPFVPDQPLSHFVPDTPNIPEKKQSTGFVPDKPAVSPFWSGVDALKRALTTNPITALADVAASPETRKSAINTAKGIAVSTIQQPAQVGQEAMNVLTGGFLRDSAPATVQDPGIMDIVKQALTANPERDIAAQVPEVERMYKERYGQGLPEALKKDLFGVISDAAMAVMAGKGIRDLAVAPKVVKPIAEVPKPTIPEPIPPETVTAKQTEILKQIDPNRKDLVDFLTNKLKDGKTLRDTIQEGMSSGLSDTQIADKVKGIIDSGKILESAVQEGKLPQPSIIKPIESYTKDIGQIYDLLQNPNQGGNRGRIDSRGFDGFANGLGDTAANTQKTIENLMDGKPLTPQEESALRYTIESKREYDLQGALKTRSEQSSQRVDANDAISPPETPGQMRPKSYPQTIKESPHTSPELAARLGGEYTVKPNAELLARAQEKVKSGADTALKDVMSSPVNDESVATAGELIKHYNAKNDFDTAQRIIDTLDPKLREAGRTIQAVALYNNLTPDGVVGFAQRRLAKVADKFPEWANKLKIDEPRANELRGLAEKIQGMPDGEPKLVALNDLNQKINSYIPSKISDQVITLWKAGLLTGIKTSGGNLLANTTHGVTELLAKGVSVPIDMAMSVFTGDRTVVAPSLRKYLGGFQEGMRRGYQFMKTGFDPRRGNPMIKYDQLQTNFGDSLAGKALKKYTDVVFRNMGAQDQPFYYGALRASLDEQLKVEGMNKGLSGQKLDSYVKNALEKGDISETITKRAVNDAQVSVFNNDTQLGKIGQGIQKAGPVGQFIVPFARTPASVVTQIINYTPVGAIKPIINGIKSAISGGTFSQRELAQALGRVGVGAPILYLGKELFDSGRMTLGIPKGEKERKQYELEGKIPNAIKVGNRWYNLNYFGPAGNLLLIGGYYQKGLNESGSITQALAQAAAGAGKSVTDQTFLQGVSGATSALNDPERFGEQMLTSTAGSVIPTLVGDIAKAMDKYQRVSVDKQDLGKSIVNAVKAKIPGVRESLPKRYDIFGKDLTAPSGPAGTMLDVTRSVPVRNTNDKTVQELSFLAQTPETMSTPTSITPKQTVAGKQFVIPTDSLYDLNKKTGQEVKKTYDQMNRYPMFARLYEKLSPEQKSIVYNDISSNIKSVNTIKYAMDNNILDQKQSLYELYKLAHGDQAKMLQFFSGRYFVPLDFLKLFSASHLLKKSATGKEK